MFMMGNVAIIGVMKELLTFMENNKRLSAEEQLEMLYNKIEDIVTAAESGWY